jgi:hypothetical protein
VGKKYQKTDMIALAPESAAIAAENAQPKEQIPNRAECLRWGWLLALWD